MKSILKSLIFLSIFLFFSPFFAYSADISQTPTSLEKAQEDIERDKKLEERVSQEKKEEGGEILEGEEKIPLEAEKKIYIREIEVEGVTLIDKSVIDNIVSVYKGKELFLTQMQKMCDLITDEYRKKGYVTSRAYLPPQTIKDGILRISVIEGKTGSLDIKGNRFFKTALLKKKIILRPGENFDYKYLQKSIRLINEHPDVKAKAILVPGQEPGTTDIVLEVTDRLPVHAGVEYDNFGSRYIEKWRFAAIGEDNNLLGFEDKLYFKYQMAEPSHYYLTTFRYSFPLKPDQTHIGTYYLWNKVKLGRELEPQRIKGRSDIGGLFLTHRLVDEYNIDLTLNGGFDYKRVKNYRMDRETSRDYARVFKGGLDLDLTDRWGRNIFTFETDAGVPDFLAGSAKESAFASRAGARADFVKLVSNYYRLQPMFFSSTMLWKNQFQFSNSTLFASEQFQIGGIANVRAYPPAAYSGDTGYAASVEWSFPVLSYVCPKELKDLKVPLSKSTFCQATRFVTFYDLGTVYNNKKLPGERKGKFLNGCGFGVRFILPEDFSVRVECATPMGETPSDDRDFRTYFELAAKI